MHILYNTDHNNYHYSNAIYWTGQELEILVMSGKIATTEGNLTFVGETWLILDSRSNRQRH